MPMPTAAIHARLAAARLEEALTDSPVVLLQGPRQCGKSTLAKTVGLPLGFDYLTFDDATTLASAKADPVSFIDSLPRRAILDEVQRAPELFLRLKWSVDRDRRPGRLLLTGSSNVLLLPALADSLAGRMETVRLHPLAQCELRDVTSHFLENLFSGRFAGRGLPRLGGELAALVVAGGFPPALERPTAARRARWYRDYVDALVQRDVRDLARISHLEALPRLLAAAAASTARLLNVTDLGNALQLSRPTLREYLTLLGRLFLVDELPAWHSNRLSRLVKTPKLHLTDTGVASALCGRDADDLLADRTELVPLVESFVHNELRRLSSGASSSVTFHHFRDKDGVEVDLVLEADARHVAGVEVKAGATVTSGDFAGLRKLAAAAGKQFSCGVVLYDGEDVAPFGDRLFAVPLRRLWE